MFPNLIVRGDPSAGRIGLGCWVDLDLERSQLIPAAIVPGSSDKRHTGKGGKINTSQAEPVAANNRAVGQFLSMSISCEAFI